MWVDWTFTLFYCWYCQVFVEHMMEIRATTSSWSMGPSVQTSQIDQTPFPWTGGVCRCQWKIPDSLCLYLCLSLSLSLSLCLSPSPSLYYSFSFYKFSWISQFSWTFYPKAHTRDTQIQAEEVHMHAYTDTHTTQTDTHKCTHTCTQTPTFWTCFTQQT